MATSGELSLLDGDGDGDVDGDGDDGDVDGDVGGDGGGGDCGGGGDGCGGVGAATTTLELMELTGTPSVIDALFVSGSCDAMRAFNSCASALLPETVESLRSAIVDPVESTMSIELTEIATASANFCRNCIGLNVCSSWSITTCTSTDVLVAGSENVRLQIPHRSGQ